MKRNDPFHIGQGAPVAVLEQPPAFDVTSSRPHIPVALPAPAAPKRKLAKLSFGQLPEKKEETKTAYPQFCDPEALHIAARIKTRAAEIERLEGLLETDKADLRQSVGLFYFQSGHGKRDVASSISLPSEEGEVLVSFANRYKKIVDENPIVAVLGEDRVAEFFRCQDTIKIDCSQVPLDDQQAFVNEFQELVAKYNCSDAVAVASEIKPIKEFHARRHVELTVEENQALEEVAPIVVMVKTKGRGEK